MNKTDSAASWCILVTLLKPWSSDHRTVSGRHFASISAVGGSSNIRSFEIASANHPFPGLGLIGKVRGESLPQSNPRAVQPAANRTERNLQPLGDPRVRLPV